MLGHIARAPSTGDSPRRSRRCQALGGEVLRTGAKDAGPHPARRAAAGRGMRVLTPCAGPRRERAGRGCSRPLGSGVVARGRALGGLLAGIDPPSARLSSGALRALGPLTPARRTLALPGLGRGLWLLALALLALGLGLLVLPKGGLAPVRLGVDPRDARPRAAAPRTADLARGAAEVGYHVPSASTRHTLPRLMGRALPIVAVALFAGHEPMRLAFPG